jgi:hypothetical protein
MKMKVPGAIHRFDSPTVLKGDTPFLGATVDDWDKAITGNMDKSLADLKARISGSTAKNDAPEATTAAAAGVAGVRLAAVK